MSSLFTNPILAVPPAQPASEDVAECLEAARAINQIFLPAELIDGITELAVLESLASLQRLPQIEEFRLAQALFLREQKPAVKQLEAILLHIMEDPLAPLTTRYCAALALQGFEHAATFETLLGDLDHAAKDESRQGMLASRALRGQVDDDRLDILAERMHPRRFFDPESRPEPGILAAEALLFCPSQSAVDAFSDCIEACWKGPKNSEPHTELLLGVLGVFDGMNEGYRLADRRLYQELGRARLTGFEDAELQARIEAVLKLEETDALGPMRCCGRMLLHAQAEYPEIVEVFFEEAAISNGIIIETKPDLGVGI